MTPEDRLAALMEAAVTDLDPPVRDILAEAERRGRRLRRRRRTMLAVASAGAVLLTAAGVDAGLRLTSSQQVGVAEYQESGAARVSAGPSGGSPGGSTTGPGSAWESAAPGAADASTASEAASGAYAAKSLVPITPTAELAILRKLLAPWAFTNPSEPSATQADLWVNGNDGKGEFTLFVGVASVKQSGMDPADCAQQGLPTLDVNDPGAVTGPGCNQVKTESGDMVLEEVVGGVHVGGYYQYRVIAYRADGVAVEITASDGVADTETVTRPAPPMTPELWAAIATDPAWQLEVPATEAQ